MRSHTTFSASHCTFFLPSLQPQSTEDATLPHSSVPHTWPSASQPSVKSSVIPEVQFKHRLSIQVSLSHNLYFLYPPNKISAKEVILLVPSELPGLLSWSTCHTS